MGTLGYIAASLIIVIGFIVMGAVIWANYWIKNIQDTNDDIDWE